MNSTRTSDPKTRKKKKKNPHLLLPIHAPLIRLQREVLLPRETETVALCRGWVHEGVDHGFLFFWGELLYVYDGLIV